MLYVVESPPRAPIPYEFARVGNSPFLYLCEPIVRYMHSAEGCTQLQFVYVFHIYDKALPESLIRSIPNLVLLLPLNVVISVSQKFDSILCSSTLTCQYLYHTYDENHLSLHSQPSVTQLLYKYHNFHFLAFSKSNKNRIQYQQPF